MWLARRETLRVSKLWTQTVLAPVVSSLLFILVFGLSLGGRIRQVSDVDYEVFIVPGLIAMAMVQAAYANNASTIFQARVRPLRERRPAPAPMRAVAGARSATTGRRRGPRRSPSASRWRFCAIPASSGVPVRAAPRAGRLAVALGLLVLFGALGTVVGIYAETWDHTTFIANIVILPLAFVGGAFYSRRAAPLARGRSCRTSTRSSTSSARCATASSARPT